MSVTKYFLLSDLNLNVKIKINSLNGHKRQDDTENVRTATRETELYVTCQIFANGKPVGLPSSTTYRGFASEPTRWNEWMTFPLKYRDLTPTSQFVFTVWEIRQATEAHLGQNTVPLGGTTLAVFNKRGMLKLGRRKLLLWSGVEGDGLSSKTTTPYKQATAEGMDKLEKALRRYEQKELPTMRWLDKLTLRRIEKMQQWHRLHPLDNESKFLTVEFPGFKHPVVYHQKTCNPTLPEISPVADRVFVFLDPEINRDNPIEMKYYKLARSAKGLADATLKPNVDDRNKLVDIISSPNKNLSVEQKQLCFRFRFFLTENKRGLTKFLRCVDWKDPGETKQALELLPKWATIDIDAALELLSADFTNKDVRKFAVKQLERADDEDLQSYLLQLVQALRYEEELPSTLFTFLTDRAVQSLSLSNFLYWYLVVETHDAVKGPMFTDALDSFLASLLMVAPEWHKMLHQENDLISKLIQLGELANTQRRVDKKVERLRQLLGPEGEMKSLRDFESTNMPVRPQIEVNGIVGERSTMFKSALAPLLLNFTTVPKEPYRVIFKIGDDLRQDQLIIQMINLMDSLLKKVKLDLKLTPYRVLATSPLHGFVEFVPNSHTLTSVLEHFDKDIRKFFDKHHPKVQNLQKALDTFVKSCAGYCVITYILGIGDRHLDNVLLTESGHLFHIDFGYIFGKDPKPFPPPMKFCKEMVEAMGGAQSTNYLEFRNYCCLAFNILRKHSGLIINLLGLMGGAGIPDLMDDVDKNLFKVQERFRLDLNDEEANFYLLSLVDESVSALFPQLVEKIHKWALYWK